jgi:hypothetical protein
LNGAWRARAGASSPCPCRARGPGEQVEMAQHHDRHGERKPRPQRRAGSVRRARRHASAPFGIIGAARGRRTGFPYPRGTHRGPSTDPRSPRAASRTCARSGGKVDAGFGDARHAAQRLLGRW